MEAGLGSMKVESYTPPVTENDGTVDTERGAECKTLGEIAEEMVRRSRNFQAETELRLLELPQLLGEEEEHEPFDPIARFHTLQAYFVGDPDPRKRLEPHFSPGAVCETKKGRRVYGDECAALIDPASGELMIVRKDRVVNHHEPSCWSVVTYNLLTGELHDRTVLVVDVRPGEDGDIVTLQIPPLPDRRNANRGHTTITLRFGKIYHVDRLETTRLDYHGRGVGPDPHRITEGEYTKDIMELDNELYLAQKREEERQAPGIRTTTALGSRALVNPRGGELVAA